MRKILPTLILTTAALFGASPAAASVGTDTSDVPTLIAAYHEAVAGHDGARLSQLFMPQGTAWFTVLSEKGWAQMRSKRPETPKVRPGSVADFVQLVSTSKAALDPQHTDLHVTSDGEIATVTFDFRFLMDGKEQNRGAESWQLIRTAEGWRIVSIIFSSSPPTGR